MKCLHDGVVNSQTYSSLFKGLYPHLNSNFDFKLKHYARIEKYIYTVSKCAQFQMLAKVPEMKGRRSGNGRTKVMYR